MERTSSFRAEKSQSKVAPRFPGDATPKTAICVNFFSCMGRDRDSPPLLSQQPVRKEDRPKPMPRYAIVVIVEAPQSETAWEKVKQQLLGSAMQDSVSYVGAPWIVPRGRRRPVEYETESIQLRLDGECVSLDPAS